MTGSELLFLSSERTSDFANWLVGMSVAGVSWFFGGIDSAYTALLTFIVIDHIVGQLAFRIIHQHSIELVKRDIVKKLLILLLVGISHIIDEILFQKATLRTAIIFFYIGNQGLSILNHAITIGLPVPKKLIELLENLRTNSDKITNSTKTSENDFTIDLDDADALQKIKKLKNERKTKKQKNNDSK